MSKVWLLLRLLTISHLTQNIPTVSGHQVFLVVDTAIRPLIFLRRVWFVPVSRENKSVERNNGSGNLRSSERLMSRAPSVEPSTRVGKPRGRSAARSGASSGESSGCATPQNPGKSWDLPASTDEVLSQVRSHLKRNSELYPRANSPEPEDLEAYGILGPSRCGSPTNEDKIVTAGEGQALIHRRKYRDESCVCSGVEAPNRVFTNTRSRSSSRAPEARNGSEKKKATNVGTRE